MSRLEQFMNVSSPIDLNFLGSQTNADVECPITGELHALRDFNNDEIDGFSAGVISNLLNI